MSDALAGKLAKAVTNLGGRLKADKRNQEQRYDYISADKVLSEAGQALAEQGIVVLASITEEANVETAYTNSRGEQRQRFDCRVAFVMTVTDGETEKIHTWLGRGSDFSVPDKAMYKAITSGHKYFLMKLLEIGEGNEDGEHQDAPPAVPGNKPAQQQQQQKPNPIPAPKEEVHFERPEPGRPNPLVEQWIADSERFYGKELAIKKRGELALHISGGRTDLTLQLTNDELIRLIKNMETAVKKAKAEAEKAAQLNDDLFNEGPTP